MSVWGSTAFLCACWAATSMNLPLHVAHNPPLKGGENRNHDHYHYQLFKTYHSFSKISGIELNTEKTEILRIGDEHIEKEYIKTG